MWYLLAAIITIVIISYIRNRARLGKWLSGSNKYVDSEVAAFLVLVTSVLHAHSSYCILKLKCNSQDTRGFSVYMCTRTAHIRVCIHVEARGRYRAVAIRDKISFHKVYFFKI
jgi:hypothetical protein